MGKGLDKQAIEEALKRAAQAVRSGDKDAAADRFTVPPRVGSASDKNQAKTK